MVRRISVHVCTRDRSTELTLLLSSLLNQTFKDFDVVIVDGSVPNPVFGTHFVSSIINRLKFEGHGVAGFVAELPGVCYARQRALEKDPWKDNDFICRLDDDVILEPDYLEKLMSVIDAGYDLASGVTPHCGSPNIMRETRFVLPIINRLEMNDKGELVVIGDDCAFLYDFETILPTDHFRSCALYKRKIHENGNDYKIGLTHVGFREEAWISLRAILAGFKLGVHTGAVNWHLQTPSGGCRFPDYGQLVGMDEWHFKSWVKRKFDEKGNFVEEYHKRVGI